MSILSGLRTRRERQPAIALAACLAFVFLLRWFTVSSHLDMGCDIATYLATTNAFFGHDPTGFGLDRPPLIALPLKVFTLVLGDLNGVKLLGILLSVAIAIPLYLLAKRVSHPWIAAAMAAVLVLTPVYSDMLTWGYITMAGLLFGLLTIHFLLSLLDKPSKANVLLTGLCASFIVGFHQLSLAFFVPLFFLVAAALLVFNRPALLKNWRPVVAAVAVAVALSLPYMPLYIRLLRLQAPTGSESSLSLAPSFWPWIAWLALSLPLLVPALKWTWRQHRNTAIVMAVLLFYSLTLMLWHLPPPFVELNRRAHYFMYPAIWLLAGVILSRLWSWPATRVPAARRWIPRAAATACMVALLVAMSVMSQVKLTDGLDFFGYVDGTRWDAIHWLKDESSPGTSIAAYPEPLGWWIEAESNRNTATVTDRNTVPYVFLKDRSLAAEQVLSRNQGLDNGNLRLATTYPYSDAPGQPVLGVYVGGSFHDIMMFDDRTISLGMEDGQTAILADDSGKEFSVTGDGDSMTMTTTYRVPGAKVLQAATLRRGSQTAVISYNVQNDGASVTSLDLPLLFGYEPETVTIAPDQRSIEVDQFLQMRSDLVSTRIEIETAGASLQSATTEDGRLNLSFNMQSAPATITLSFVVTEPSLDDSADVTHYDVPRILREPALEHLPSIDYIAVDLRPNPHLASELAWGTEEWLNASPYYKLVYSEGDIRIYEVVAAALP